jgi:hypothetical protein
MTLVRQTTRRRRLVVVVALSIDGLHCVGGWPSLSRCVNIIRSYSIPNGPPGPSTAQARFGPALCGPMAFSCRAVSGVMPNWRPRHGPMANFSGRAGTTPRTARWAATRHGTIADGMEARAAAQAAHGGRRGRSSDAPRRRPVRPELQPPRRI